MYDDFIRRMPKAELHLHIEGTLEPELMLALSLRNRVATPYATAAAARAAYDFGDLRSFLHVYYQGMDVLRTKQDFTDLAAAYGRRASSDGIRHVEVFFDPQVHLARGVPFADMVEGIAEGLMASEREYGISWRLIMCFLRDQPVDDAERVLDLALAYRNLIAGVGLDSAEIGHPPRDFAAVFARARAAGFAGVAHAGEEGSAACVREALDVLVVQRIDHGVHAADDPLLVDRLQREQIALTMCPLSNQRLGVTPDLAQHPLKRLLDAGVPVTVNSDDPAYFGGYLLDNYVVAQQALDLSKADIRALARNSITSSLLSAEAKLLLLAELDATTA